MRKKRLIAAIVRQLGLLGLLTLIAWSIQVRSGASNSSVEAAHVPLASASAPWGYSNAYYYFSDFTATTCIYHIVDECHVTCGPTTFSAPRENGSCHSYALRIQEWITLYVARECVLDLVQTYYPSALSNCQDVQQSEMTEGICTNAGYYWNFTSYFCQDTPSTQLQCDSADWYWNFTNNVCGSDPAIGMCGGGPDWGNYPSTGCYLSGLGIYGSVCNRSNAFISRCNGDYDAHYCGCTGCDWCGGSPIVISTTSHQFDMTDVAHGVLFDLNANGTRDKVSWTSANSDEAWLALDRNHNGVIDSGKELFGNFTFQTEPPSGVEKNGFLALAEYDKPENGGNDDGLIDNNDAVFAHLLLWHDANQNGVSEASELRTLSDSQIESISLDYRDSHRTDRYGNTFRYRAKVYGPQHSELGRWAYDVFLTSAH